MMFITNTDLIIKHSILKQPGDVLENIVYVDAKNSAESLRPVHRLELLARHCLYCLPLLLLPSTSAASRQSFNRQVCSR